MPRSDYMKIEVYGFLDEEAMSMTPIEFRVYICGPWRLAWEAGQTRLNRRALVAKTAALTDLRPNIVGRVIRSIIDKYPSIDYPDARRLLSLSDDGKYVIVHGVARVHKALKRFADQPETTPKPEPKRDQKREPNGNQTRTTTLSIDSDSEKRRRSGGKLSRERCGDSQAGPAAPKPQPRGDDAHASETTNRSEPPPQPVQQASPPEPDKPPEPVEPGTGNGYTAKVRDFAARFSADPAIQLSVSKCLAGILQPRHRQKVLRSIASGDPAHHWRLAAIAVEAWRDDRVKRKGGVVAAKIKSRGHEPPEKLVRQVRLAYNSQGGDREAEEPP